MENEKLLTDEVESKGISLNLKQEFFYIKDKKGRKTILKDERNEPRYTRNDIIGLMELLGKFDSRLHTMKDYKQWIKVKDKLKECFVNNLDLLKLSLDEAAFLKEFLTDLTIKDSKDSRLVEFEIRSLVGILEQLSE